jgi:hypothetical protein
MHGQRRLPRERPQEEHEASELPLPMPEVAHLLALQRSVGNAAVARAVLARKKFANQEAAIEWLQGKGEPDEDQTEDAWFDVLLDADKSGYQLQSHRAANKLVLKNARAKAARGAKQQAKSVRAPKAKEPKREVPESVMTHVVDGVVKDGKPTGFHSTKGTRPVMEKTGDPEPRGSDGCYWSNVQSIKDKTKKKLGSTFYPDTWTAAQIKTAIEYAEGKGNSFLTTDDAPTAGIPLYYNGESYYPSYR